MIDLYCAECGEEIEVRYTQSSIIIIPCTCTYDNGEKDGYQRGYSDGYNEGYEKGFEAAMKD